MEDAATAEISRSQVWQEIRNQVVLADTGETVTRELVARLLDEEAERLRGEVPAEQFERYYLPGQGADRRPLPERRLHRLPHPARVRAGDLLMITETALRARLVGDAPRPTRRPAGRHRRVPGRDLPGRGRPPAAGAHRLRAGRQLHRRPAASGGDAQAADLVGRARRLGGAVPRGGSEPRSSAAAVAPRVEAKLAAEPIEDLRLDFEDGYGNRGDDAEDAEAVRAARELAAALADGRAPGLRGPAVQVLRGADPAPWPAHPRSVPVHPARARRPARQPGDHLPEGQHGQPGRGHGRGLRGVRDARPACRPAGCGSRSRWRRRS